VSELNIGMVQRIRVGSNMGMSSDLASIIAVIECSQIVVAAIPVPPAYLFRRSCLPAGFEAVDVAVLEWIVAHRPAVSSDRTGWSNFATATNRVPQWRAC
jgi:hypothetical protein